MGLLDQKITDALIAEKGIVSAPDRLTGTVEENKALFDKLIRDGVKNLFNGLIDQLLDSAAAAELGALKADGETATTVQGALAEIYAAVIHSGNMPAGGAAGQFLKKLSEEDYAYGWGETGDLDSETAALLWPTPPEDPTVSKALARLSNGMLYGAKTLNDLSVGDAFQLNETISGTTSAADFILLSKNYEGTGRGLVLRRDLIAQSAWNSTNVNTYSGSTIDEYLSNTYLSYLDPSVQAKIGNVGIPYTTGNGNWTVTTLDRKVFALSVTELGSIDATANIEGTALDYFGSNADRIANYNSTASIYWTRSPRIINTVQAEIINAGGAAVAQNSSIETSMYVRPAFTLPINFDIGEKKVTDLLDNELTLGAQIAVGSYTGTGTSGSTNKNSLILPFTPKIGIIKRRTRATADSETAAAIFIYGSTYVPGIGSGYATSTENIAAWNRNSVSWYASGCWTGNSSSFQSSATAGLQLNVSGIVYDWCFIK